MLSIWKQIKMKTSAKHRTKIITLWKNNCLRLRWKKAVQQLKSFHLTVRGWSQTWAQKLLSTLKRQNREISTKSAKVFTQRLLKCFQLVVCGCGNWGDFCERQNRWEATSLFTITPRSLFLFVICWRRWLLLSASHQQITFKPHLIPDQMIQHERF